MTASQLCRSITELAKGYMANRWAFFFLLLLLIRVHTDTYSLHLELASDRHCDIFTFVIFTSTLRMWQLWLDQYTGYLIFILSRWISSKWQDGFSRFFFFIIVPKRCADYLKACRTWLVWPSLAQRLEADGNPDPKLSQSVRCIYQNARHYLERNSLTFFWNAVILFLKKFTWGLMSLWCLNNIFSSKWKVKLNTPTSHTRMT